jgi:hypothetical protein
MKTQRTAPHLCHIQRVDNWRILHEIGPRLCDQIDPLHGLASIDMNPRWMVR